MVISKSLLAGRTIVVMLLVGCGSGPLDKPTGAEGGPCYGNGTCDRPLMCDASKVCVNSAPDAGTPDSGTPDPCDGQTCSDHGTCVVNDGTAACVCNGGTHANGLTCIADDDGPLLSFPGAVGFGALARGGRGGVVVYVTHLGDAGDGSLRAALEMSGPRTVIFRISGTIALNSTINVDEPYLTIAGQTAPGGGVAVRHSGAGGFGNALVAIRTHDVVVRHVRFRRGPSAEGECCGAIINKPSDVGGWPDLAGGTPYPDVDQDGMDDAWELEVGLDPSDSQDGKGDRDGDGYTNLEEFLNCTGT